MQAAANVASSAALASSAASIAAGAGAGGSSAGGLLGAFAGASTAVQVGVVLGTSFIFASVIATGVVAVENGPGAEVDISSLIVTNPPSILLGTSDFLPTPVPGPLDTTSFAPVTATVNPNNMFPSAHHSCRPMEAKQERLLR
jgi:hypothetical protein